MSIEIVTKLFKKDKLRLLGLDPKKNNLRIILPFLGHRKVVKRIIRNRRINIKGSLRLGNS